MIRVPGMKASGERTKALVETVDIYPTLMDVAGLDQPHELEGISLLPLTNEPNQEWKEAVFAQFPRYAKHQALMGETVRTDRYRYTAWVGVRSGKIIVQELYDHKIDPIESVNLVENSDYINDLKYHEKLRIMGWENIHNEMNKKISKNLIN
jgi:arylsulfatase A-like enzyme